MRNVVPPGAYGRRMSNPWFEENAPGQRVPVGPQNITDPSHLVPVLEITDFGKPQALCLQLDRHIVSGSTGAYNCSVKAHITYGVGGASDSFECDWNDGGLVTIVAQRLTVTAHGSAPNVNQPYDVGDFRQDLLCGVGEGQPSVIMPTLTEGIPSFGPGLSVAFEPPAFAKAVSVLAENEAVGFVDPYPDLQLVFVHKGTFTPQGRIFGEYIGGGAAAPVPPDSQVFIRNTSAADNLRGSLIWHLGL